MEGFCKVFPGLQQSFCSSSLCWTFIHQYSHCEILCLDGVFRMTISSLLGYFLSLPLFMFFFLLTTYNSVKYFECILEFPLKLWNWKKKKVKLVPPQQIRSEHIAHDEWSWRCLLILVSIFAWSWISLL